MRLSDILKYNDIVIQCHDNPDADALASGFALYTFLTAYGKNLSLYTEVTTPSRRATS